MSSTHQPSLFEEEKITSSSFLEDVWKKISPGIKDPANTYIILPGVRAGLFYKDLYKKFATGSMVLPNITTIYTFIDQFSPYQTIDSSAAIFELYKCYREIFTGEEADEFNEFYKWARLVLNDFNEVDNYLIDARHLYSNLQNLKELEEWSFNEEEINFSPSQKNFISFWDKLYPIYKAFDGYLKLRGLAYSGKKVRWFAEEIEDFLDKHENIQCHFIGFNALNRAEENIIDALVKDDKAQVYWDIDPYYHNNADQEAGKFFPPKNYDRRHHFIEGGMTSNDLQIDIVAVPKMVGQVKVAAAVLEKIPQNDLPKTAVVLANEALLVPLLNSIPKEIAQLNLTMGLPLRLNPIYSLIESLFEINANEKADQTIPAQVIRKVLEHQFLSTFFRKNSGVLDRLARKRYLTPASLLDEESSDLEKTIFGHWENDPRRCLASIQNLVFIFREKRQELETGKLENEFLYELARVLTSLEHVLKNYDGLIDIKLFRKLLFDELNRLKVSFIGEPLKGLQIMGMLETRALDFENLIVLGANEGIMPAAPTETSLIPNDLKKYYGLPTHEKREAIYAYYVYRLLHRSKRVHFLYNNVIDQLGGSEMSRFLLQLSEELPVANSNCNIRQLSARGPAGTQQVGKFSVAKSPEVIEKIKEHLAGGVSPSALNTLIRCPLNFYYKYVLRLTESDDPEEEVSAAEFGTLVHRMLELVYEDMEEKPVTTSFLKQQLGRLDEFAERSLQETMNQQVAQGKTLLSLELARYQVSRLIKKELERIADLDKTATALMYLGSEKTMTFSTVIDSHAGQIPLVFKGKIDRIEKTGATVWVIDYKTGKVEAKDVTIKSWDELKKPAKSKALQLAVYGLALHNEYPGFQLRSGIVSTIKPDDEPLSFRLDKNPVLFGKKEEEQLILVLTDIVNELLDPEIPFEHDPQSTYCPFCK